MANRVYIFDDAPEEIQAAVALEPVAHILIRVSPEREADIARLKCHGFLPVPPVIESVIELPFRLENVSRKLRKQIREALDTWNAAGLSLVVDRVADIERHRIIEELYRPVFLPAYYAKGISPYNAHNQQSFEKLLQPGNFVAWVRQGNEIAGGAILSQSAGRGDFETIHGNSPSGIGVEGLVYALSPRLEKAGRALIYAMIRAFESAGMSYFSLGKDLPWIEKGYMSVFFEKQRWASGNICPKGKTEYFFSVCEKRIARGEQVLILTTVLGKPSWKYFGAENPALSWKLNKYYPHLECQIAKQMK